MRMAADEGRVMEMWCKVCLEGSCCCCLAPCPPSHRDVAATLTDAALNSILGKKTSLNDQNAAAASSREMPLVV